MDRHTFPLHRDIGTLIDAAQRRSGELRRQAMDELWDQAAQAARAQLRAAQRLAARLVRHRQLRG